MRGWMDAGMDGCGDGLMEGCTVDAPVVLACVCNGWTNGRTGVDGWMDGFKHGLPTIGKFIGYLISPIDESPVASLTSSAFDMLMANSKRRFLRDKCNVTNNKS